MNLKESLMMGILENEFHKVGIDIKSGGSYRPFNEVVIDSFNKWNTMDAGQKKNMKNMLKNLLSKLK